MSLDQLPVLGVLIQFVGYLLDQLPFIAHAAVAVSIPTALAATCGVMCERSGVVNIGIEGTMLAAAFTAWVVGIGAAGILGHGDPGLFGATLPLLIALAAAVLVAVLISWLHAWLSITAKADQIISGTIINIAALGVTGYLNTIIAATSPVSAGAFTRLSLPPGLATLPGVGWIFAALLSQ